MFTPNSRIQKAPNLRIAVQMSAALLMLTLDRRNHHLLKEAKQIDSLEGSLLFRSTYHQYQVCAAILPIMPYKVLTVCRCAFLAAIQH